MTQRIDARVVERTDVDEGQVTPDTCRDVTNYVASPEAGRCTDDRGCDRCDEAGIAADAASLEELIQIALGQGGKYVVPPCEDDGLPPQPGPRMSGEVAGDPPFPVRGAETPHGDVRQCHEGGE